MEKIRLTIECEDDNFHRAQAVLQNIKGVRRVYLTPIDEFIETAKNFKLQMERIIESESESNGRKD